MSNDSAAPSPFDIGLLGSGGQAREIASYLSAGAVFFHAVSARYRNHGDPREVDIETADPALLATPVVGATGAPGLRRRLVSEWQGRVYGTVVSPAAYVGPGCRIGVGSVVAPGATLALDVTLGDHTQINVGATLSHDTTAGAFVTVGPGAHIAGNVHLGDGVFVGIGATISHGVKVARGTVIGAGATVLTDVPSPNSVVYGVPARLRSVREDWLDDL